MNIPKYELEDDISEAKTNINKVCVRMSWIMSGNTRERDILARRLWIYSAGEPEERMMLAIRLT